MDQRAPQLNPLLGPQSLVRSGHQGQGWRDGPRSPQCQSPAHGGTDPGWRSQQSEQRGEHAGPRARRDDAVRTSGRLLLQQSCPLYLVGYDVDIMPQ